MLERRLSHRKWRKTKQKLSWWPDLALHGCCLVSLHFLCDILCSSTVLVISRRHKVSRAIWNGRSPSFIPLHNVLFGPERYFRITASTVRVHLNIIHVNSLCGEWKLRRGKFSNIYHSYTSTSCQEREGIHFKVTATTQQEWDSSTICGLLTYMYHVSWVKKVPTCVSAKLKWE